jgi:hypothetical protein
MRESVIEKYLVDCAKSMGGEVRKVKWVGRKGAPDRLVMLPAHKESRTEPTTIWIELKATGKKPEAHQLREHVRMRKLGQRVEVVDSLDRVHEVLGLV